MKKIISILSFTLALQFTAMPGNAQFSLSIGVNVTTAPPPLPSYTQPPCPVDGYLWSPGYWAWDDADGYYCVPGVWIMPPQTGYLWTPGYWGYDNGSYGWHGGYWGTHVGFYGGKWDGGHYRYNTAVVQINQTVVHNTYVDRIVISNTIINNTTVNNRFSYNGGAGIKAKPTAVEQQAMHETHVRPTSDQITHNQAASKDKNQFAVVNKGRPCTMAIAL